MWLKISFIHHKTKLHLTFNSLCFTTISDYISEPQNDLTRQSHKTTNMQLQNRKRTHTPQRFQTSVFQTVEIAKVCPWRVYSILKRSFLTLCSCRRLQFIRPYCLAQFPHNYCTYSARTFRVYVLYVLHFVYFPRDFSILRNKAGGECSLTILFAWKSQQFRCDGFLAFICVYSR